MKLKFVIPAVLIAGAAGVLAFETLKKDNYPADKNEMIVTLVGQVLKQFHYDPKNIDDSFSVEVYTKYLDDLDGEKKFFLQSDIAYLDRYKTSIDEEVKGEQNLDFTHDADSIFDIRMKQAQKIYPAILERPFDFNGTDSIQLDRDKVGYPADSGALGEVWYKMMKYRTLLKLIELKEEKKRAVDTAAIKKEGSADLEADARRQVKKIYDLYFDRMRSHFTEKERFSAFMNAITGSMDPHSNYFSPLDKRYFDEQMSGTFYGIGAQLRQDVDVVKIENIVTGGPAWKQGQLKAGDIIQKVAQGDAEPVDMTGFTTEDAVKLIRGSKGTVVKLTVKHIDGTVETVAISRGEVKIEDTFARSYLINSGSGKVGFIVLPEFYFNKSGTTGPGSSAFDVGQEIKKLKTAGVDGIILDLRFNPGGSLGDAIDMAGLFVPQGAVVQVRSRGGAVNVLKSYAKEVAYTGPLAIMVNEYSASASEILAAAMQDYKRAVIIGSPHTYGKGTVQRMVDLSDLLPKTQQEKFGPLGSIKLTIQKFYRISGGSTQLEGVASDIELPDPYYDVAEQTDKDALPWDNIQKADYTVWRQPVDVSDLKKKSDLRMKNDKAFQMIEANIQALKKIDKEKKFPLNMQGYTAFEDSNNAELKKIDNVKQLIEPIRISNLKADMTTINVDSIRAHRNRDLLKGYSRDPYLSEALQVMDDMINKPSMQQGKLTKAAKEAAEQD